MQNIDASDLAGAEDGGTDNAHVKAQRADFEYEPHANLSQPVIIRGTNRIFRTSPSLTVVAQPSEQALDKLIGDCREVDTHLRLLRLASVADIQLQIVTPDVITFKVAEQEGIYFFETPTGKKNPLGFKRFSSLLGIPYAFSKKNPTFLNKVNFDYYLRMAMVSDDKPKSLDIIHDAEPVEIQYIPTTAEGEALEKPPETVLAYRVSNVLKVVRSRGRQVEAEDGQAPEAPPIATRIPFFSEILSGIREQLHNVAPEIGLQLQAHALGYDDAENKGRHFARLVFDSPATQFDGPNGEPYQLALNIETDFSGEAKDFGDVGISFVIFRQICSNGMAAAWGTKDQAVLREQYVLDQLEAVGLADGESEEATVMRQQAEARFHLIFGEAGMSVPVTVANAGLDTSAFALGLKFFLDSKGLQQQRLQDLKAEFEAVDEEEFVRTVHAVQDSFKLASPELVKYFIIEWMAGQITGKQQFHSPWDVVQFLTLLGRAYDTAVVADVERKAIGFALEMAARLSKQHAENQISLSDNYRRMVNQRLLGAGEVESV